MLPASHTPEQLKTIFAKFNSTYTVVKTEQYHGGHINRTYFVETEAPGHITHGRYILQCVNTFVFPNIERLMDNVFRISEHLERNSKDPRDYLHFYRTADGGYGVPDGPEGFWRLYRYIGDAVGRTEASSPNEARVAAEAFGRFQARLADMTGPRLCETIEKFHDTRNRFANLEKAAEADVKNRLSSCRDLLEGFRAIREPALSVQKSFEAGEMPERIVHNDAKFANILLDTHDQHAVCVIDLDTCMPGLSLHDFGDLVRSMTGTAAEDEPDVSKIAVRPEMFEALKDGFLREAGDVLTPAEHRLLANGGLAMTTEVGVRFLTDYLQGDVYFSTKYPEHNLVRARSQLTLARAMLDKLPIG